MSLATGISKHDLMTRTMSRSGEKIVSSRGKKELLAVNAHPVNKAITILQLVCGFTPGLCASGSIVVDGVDTQRFPKGKMFLLVSLRRPGRSWFDGDTTTVTDETFCRIPQVNGILD